MNREVEQFILDSFGKDQGAAYFEALDSRHDQKYIKAIEGSLGFQTWKATRATKSLFHEILVALKIRKK